MTEKALRNFSLGNIAERVFFPVGSHMAKSDDPKINSNNSVPVLEAFCNLGLFLGSIAAANSANEFALSPAIFAASIMAKNSLVHGYFALREKLARSN